MFSVFRLILGFQPVQACLKMAERESARSYSGRIHCRPIIVESAYFSASFVKTAVITNPTPSNIVQLLFVGRIVGTSAADKTDFEAQYFSCESDEPTGSIRRRGRALSSSLCPTGQILALSLHVERQGSRDGLGAGGPGYPGRGPCESPRVPQIPGG